MKSKTTLVFSFGTFIFFIMLLVLPSTLSLSAQTILPQKLGYPRICANIPNVDYPNGYNRYEVPFKLSAPSTDSYVVIISSDNFSTVIKPKIIPNGPTAPIDTPTDKTLTFEVPSDLVGSDVYQLKVQNASGSVTSQAFISSDSKTSFPIHFLSFSGPFYINNKSNTLSFCIGGSVILAIDNTTPSVPNSSPVQYPHLKYKWYKNDVVVPNETKSTLSVNQPGEYYVEVDYGPCSDLNTHSQRVVVSSGSGSGTVITSSLGNPFCSNSGNTTLTASAGNSYVWRKDNVVINGAISQTYQTNVAGIYTCDVDFGGCKSTGTIDLKVQTTNSTISGVQLDKVNYITEGETLDVSITSSSSSPTYQWFLNDVAIPGADTSSLAITAQGNYKGTVSQTSGCMITDEFPFKVAYKVNLNVEKIPNVVSPNGDGVNDTWIIPDKYQVGTNTHIMILNSLGEVVFQTDNYDNYNGWPQTTIEFNFNPVYYYIITPKGESVKKGSITLLK